MIEREEFDWGVQLTTQPFAEIEVVSMLTIRAEVSQPKGAAKITFSGVSGSRPLKLSEAQEWASALNAMVQECQRVAIEMKAANDKPKRAKTKKKS
jgi:hypothetical protein